MREIQVMGLISPKDGWNERNSGYGTDLAKTYLEREKLKLVADLIKNLLYGQESLFMYGCLVAIFAALVGEFDFKPRPFLPRSTFSTSPVLGATPTRSGYESHKPRLNDYQKKYCWLYKSMRSRLSLLEAPCVSH